MEPNKIEELEKKLSQFEKRAKSVYEQVDGVSKKTLNGIKNTYKELEKDLKKIAESNDALEKERAKAALERLNIERKAALDNVQVTGRIKNEVLIIGQNYKDFLTTTAAQYNLGQQVAKTYKQLSRDLGTGGMAAERMKKSFKDALPDVVELGMSQENLAQIYEKISEETGRVSTLRAEEARLIGAMAQGTGLMGSEVADMTESFNLMGVSTEKMNDLVFETFKTSQAMGLNANKVVKVLQQNMNQMQSYSFKGGVKGMTEMAKQAVKMRLDVSDILQMSDKFYQPEAAIEAAANLQMLGGDIAKAFGDPFETMYLARNKPEELAKKVGEMTENMMQFNEETGEFEMPAEVRMQLKAAGDQLGINVDKMVEMSRQTSKIKDIKMKFSMSGLDEEAKDSIASLATYKDGKYVIQHDGKDLGLDEINQGMAEEIMKANQSQEDDFKDIAINTQTMSEKLTSMEEAMKLRASLIPDTYEISAGYLEENMVGPLKDSMEGATQAFVATAGDAIKKSLEASGMENELGELTSELNEFAKTVKEKGISSIENLGDITDDIFKKYFGDEAQDDVKDSSGKAGGDVKNDFLMREDGSTVSFSSEDDIIGAKRGGPLDKLMDKGLPNNNMVGGTTPTKMEFGNINISGRIEIVSPDGSTNGMDMSSLKPQIEKMIISHMNGSFRNGGVSSSKETTDYMG